MTGWCHYFILFLVLVVCHGQVELTSILPGEWNLQITTHGTTQSVEHQLDEWEEEEEQVAVPDTFLNVTKEENGSRLVTALIHQELGLNIKLTIQWKNSLSGKVSAQSFPSHQSPEQNGNIEVDEFDSDNEDNEKDSIAGKVGENTMLFTFDFSNHTNGYLGSHGPISGIDGHPIGTYYWFFTGTTKFVMVINKDATTATDTTDATTSGSIIITGLKTLPPQPEQSLWASFYTPMMIMGVYMMTRLFKPSLPQPPRQEDAPTQNPPRVREEDKVD